jgi:predicted nucleic acid-binding protein
MKVADLEPGPVALDTALFIYWIEEHPSYLPLVEPIFSAIEAGRLMAVTSAVTLLEVLVGPYRANVPSLAERYEFVLTKSPGLRLVPLDSPLLRVAAQIRAASGLKTPDALQLAAAVSTGCKVFLTHDRRLPDRVAGVKVITLTG